MWLIRLKSCLRFPGLLSKTTLINGKFFDVSHPPLGGIFTNIERSHESVVAVAYVFSVTLEDD